MGSGLLVLEQVVEALGVTQAGCHPVGVLAEHLQQLLGIREQIGRVGADQPREVLGQPRNPEQGAVGDFFGGHP